MKKWIRWKGLGAFIFIIIILCLFWFIFIDLFIERVIENKGTEWVGAKVELQEADLSLFPIGLELKGLQVTNPDEPMKNMFEVEQIMMSIGTLRLMRRQLIINDMALGGIKLNTQRESSGAVSGKLAQVSDTSERIRRKKYFQWPSLELPNIKEILAKEDLESLNLIEDVQNDVHDQKEQWVKKLKDLPDESQIAEYKNKIERIKTEKKGLSHIMNAVKDLEEIQKEIKNDINRIKDAHEDYKNNLDLLKKFLAQIEKAPEKDFLRLREKYTPSPENLGNITRLLFGEKIGHGIDMALAWYERIMFVLERARRKGATGKKVDEENVKPLRGKGQDIHFQEFDPMPDFLIRQAKASIQLKAGDLEGIINNITTDQAILGTPLTFLLSGNNLKDLESVKIEGSLNHISPGKSDDRFSAIVQGYQAKDLILSDHKHWPISLKEGLVDFTIDARLFDNKAINTEVKIRGQSAKFFIDIREDASQISKAIGSALSDISKFKIDADMSGTIHKMDLRIQSDLDQVLKSSVNKLVKERANKLQEELKPVILAQIEGPLEDLRKNMAGLQHYNGEFQNRSDILNNVLKDTMSKGDLGGLKLPF
jgi:uncharacterized protein (TIGR03545 family)